mmetsp:Transcript_19552/g.40944  ORF Transcript_19552/g.40944 Transcript_19552/m.40944 type:complete len:110 (+) Transcript_19552:54-383(+)
MGATPTVGVEKTIAPTPHDFQTSPRPTAPSVPIETCTSLDKIERCDQQSINNPESFARICANLGCSVDACGPNQHRALIYNKIHVAMTLRSAKGLTADTVTVLCDVPSN